MKSSVKKACTNVNSPPGNVTPMEVANPLADTNDDVCECGHDKDLHNSWDEEHGNCKFISDNTLTP